MSRETWVTVLVAVGGIFVGSLGAVGARVLWHPVLVYEIVETESLLGPGVADMVEEAREARFDQVYSSVSEAHPQLGSSETYDQAMRQYLSSSDILADHYLRARVANRGRAAARDVRISILVPGVVGEVTVDSDARPDLAWQYVRVWDEKVPVGITVSEEALPRMVPGENATIHIWYMKESSVGGQRLGYEPRVAVTHAEGQAKRLNEWPLASGFLSFSWSLMVVLGVLAVLSFVAAEYTERRRRQVSTSDEAASSTTPTGEDGTNSATSPDDDGD